MRPQIALAMVILLALLVNSTTGCQLFSESPATPGPISSPTPSKVAEVTKGPAGMPTQTPVIQPTDGPTPTPGPEGRVDGYLAVAPRVLRSGMSEAVSVSLFSGRQWASGNIALALLKDGQPVAQAAAYVQGRQDVILAIPKLAEGDYQLQLTGNSFQARSPVRIEEGTMVFLESDKPIYKPGQTIHIRTLTLDPELKPVAGRVSIEVMDAKGLKVFKREVSTDDYGMTSTDLPLSPEPNLGVWKLVAKLGQRTAQLDVRVERYVLPKYEVKVNLAKEWALASEPIKGTIQADYSYGKPVKGEVQIKASRYVGQWEEYATITRELDGQVGFEVPAVEYVSGVPSAGGMGNVTLDVTVKEKSTGYEEKTTRMLTVAAAPITLKVIPESSSFKPGLPLSLLIIAETPDNRPVDAEVQVGASYLTKDFNTREESHSVAVMGGKALLKINPPEGAIALNVYAYSDQAGTSLMLKAGYSPSGSFIQVEQVSSGTLKVGDTAQFRVYSTREAANFYYEIVSRGRVVFSDFSRTSDIQFGVTPLMAPSARLLVYQVLSTSEVAADYLPFSVSGEYPQKVGAAFSEAEARPGQDVVVNVQTEGPAKVGLAAVDRSVFILAENRLNLQQVFDELERLYQQPRAELHEADFIGNKLRTRGAKEVFDEAGVVVLSNQKVPEGEDYEFPMLKAVEEAAVGDVMPLAPQDMAKAAQPAATSVPAGAGGDLAEVKRIRQFFPETWIWEDVTTDASGKASKQFAAPDSITTWMLRAVALSKDKGLGIGEAQLKVLQPFFVTVDLPYSAIRGEELPVKVSLYNYTDRAEDFTVELEQSDWFNLVSERSKTVRVGASDLAGVSFTIQPRGLGIRQIKVTARSRTSADAIVKDMIVEPEGVAREIVENAVLSANSSRQLDLAVPIGIIDGSSRGYVALTGSYLTQTIEGLESLLQMPYGCGEQNMILFAPNVFVARYLKETNQLKPEVMAKAELLMTTGYQRELTYRRGDGSFSAFGDQDQEGSLWLTAFVLKTFAQARDLIYVDEEVLRSASAWIVQHQNSDGSFDPVGFLHHQELLGGLQGKTALTAYVAIALKEAGEDTAADKAMQYLEGVLDDADDAYSVAITAYALEMAKSAKAQAAYEKLMDLAQESDEGLYWGDERPIPEPGLLKPEIGGDLLPSPEQNGSAAVETTGYATLALLQHGDKMNASRAARWLVSQRNAFGGFSSTQDTVVGLQALTSFAAGSRSDVDATVTLRTGSLQKEVRISPENADVLQVVDVPVGGPLTVEVNGKGQVVLQTVRRFNVPKAVEAQKSVFQLEVEYGTGHVQVNDLIDVTASIKYTPPQPLKAGMVVFDVAIPTGFAPVEESVQRMVDGEPRLKRFEIAGRKVILYIEDMNPGDELEFTFQAQALYPVKAQAVTSQAYSYYRPEFRGESLGGEMVVEQ